MYGASWWKVQSALNVDLDDQIRLLPLLNSRGRTKRSDTPKPEALKLPSSGVLRDRANDAGGPFRVLCFDVEHPSIPRPDAGGRLYEPAALFSGACRIGQLFTIEAHSTFRCQSALNLGRWTDRLRGKFPAGANIGFIRLLDGEQTRRRPKIPAICAS